MNSQRTRLNVLVLAMALLLPGQTTQAGTLQSQADSMFNGLVNGTAPQAFKGQTMNTYTGGSMFVRVPSKNYQVLSLQMPYIKAGNSCGSIDAFGGSFSHISSAQFKDMLKNITSAIPGVLFQLAIKSVEPLLGDTMQWFQSIENIVNRANISSCEGAKMALSSANDFLGLSTAKTCETVAGMIGKADDVAAGRIKCGDSAGVQDVMNGASANAATLPLVPLHGNLVWQALKQNTKLDDDDRQLIMSITGTTVYPASYADGQPAPEPIWPTITNAKVLIYGDTAVDVNGNSTIPVLSCGGDTTDCLNPTTSNTTFQALSYRVQKIMASLSDKIATRSAAPTSTEITFVNNVPAPVYRMLAAGNTVNNSAISAALQGQYNDYVAIEFAHALLTRAARQGVASGLFNANMLPVQVDQFKRHVGLAQDMVRELDGERQTAAAKAQVFVSLSSHVAELERDMRGAMPQQVRDLLAYSALGH